MLNPNAAAKERRLARLKAVRRQERSLAQRTVRDFEARKAAAVASRCSSRQLAWESDKWRAVDELNGRAQAGLHCIGAAHAASEPAAAALLATASDQAGVWEALSIAVHQRGRTADRVEHAELRELAPAQASRRAVRRRVAAEEEGATARAAQQLRAVKMRAAERARFAARPRPVVVTKEVSPAELRRREVTYRQRDFSRTRFHSDAKVLAATPRASAPVPIVSVSRHTARAPERLKENLVNATRRAAMETTRKTVQATATERANKRGSAAIKWEVETHGIAETIESLRQLQRADRRQQAQSSASGSRSFIVRGKPTTEHYATNQREIERAFEKTFLNRM